MLRWEESWVHSIARSTSISAISERNWTPTAVLSTSRRCAAAAICLRRAGRMRSPEDAASLPQDISLVLGDRHPDRNLARADLGIAACKCAFTLACRL